MEEHIVFPFSNTGCAGGCFGLDPLEGQEFKWVTCRDVVQMNLEPHMPGFWFSLEPNEIPNLAKFLERIEIILNLEERTRVFTTDRPKLVRIQPARFWRVCELRKSLFTLLTRVGRAYDPVKGVQAALQANAYTKGSLPAVDRFLYGFTRYEGDPLVKPYATSPWITAGFYSIFGGKNEDFCRRHLLPPDTASGQDA